MKFFKTTLQNLETGSTHYETVAAKDKAKVDKWLEREGLNYCGSSNYIIGSVEVEKPKTKKDLTDLKYI